MDIEQQGKRTVYSGEIEELLERERKARQNNQHHHSVTILQEIVCSINLTIYRSN